MQNFFQWLRRVLHWVRNVPITRHYWWSVAVVAVTVVVVGAFGWTEQAFRISSMALQLGGVLTVVWGILKTRTGFGQPSIRSQFKAWCTAFPPYRLPKLVASGTITFPGITVSGHAYGSDGPTSDRTLEGRMSHLETIVKSLQVALGNTHFAVIQAEKKAQQALDETAHLLKGQIGAVDKKIEETATGGIHVAAVGAIWIFFGTVFGGLAPELHKFLTL